MRISESTSMGVNHAVIENGEVNAVLNESTKERGYMPISEAKGFAHSIIDALYKKDSLLTENGKHNARRG